MSSPMRSVLLAAFVAAMLAGCSGSGPTPSPASSIDSFAAPPASQALAGPAFSGDPCALLTDDEITKITKQPIVSKTSGQELGVFDVGCDWEVGPPNQVTWSIQVGVIPSGGRSYYDQYFAPFEGTPITGVGDVALQLNADEVLAVSGDVLAGVTVIAPGNKDKTLPKQLMQLVITRV
jgi:hypothetical protein